jgi:hypothetical protein
MSDRTDHYRAARGISRCSIVLTHSPLQRRNQWRLEMFFGQIILYALAVMFFFSGMFASAEAKSAIHQIYAVLEYGFGSLIIGLLLITHAINSAKAAQKIRITQ